MLADADLIGGSWRALVSEKTGEKIELKARTSDQARLVTLDELMAEL
jgi:hypothetical protein